MAILWTIKLLGGLSIQRAGQQQVHLHATKPNLLLAYLAVNLNKEVSRDALIDMLWPDAEFTDGRRSLSQALSSLQRLFRSAGLEQTPVMVADNSCVLLEPQVFTTDLQILNTAVKNARHCADKETRLDLMRDAVDLYTGELLPNFNAEWVLGEREHVSTTFINMLQQLIFELNSMGRTREALEDALRSAKLEPDREDVHEEVIKLYIRLNLIDDAVRHFEAYREHIMRTFGLAPDRSLALLMEPYRARRLPAGYNEADDVIRIAAPLNRFFNRESEISQIVTYLLGRGGKGARAPEVSVTRLVTITGPGGWGKTRLAEEAARIMSVDFQHRVAFVRLVGAARSDRVIRVIANALHLSKTGESLSEQIRAKLRGGLWLIILDGCEHLQPIRTVVQALLEDLPELYLLATSPMPLDVVGERLVVLRPLKVPRQANSRKALLEYASAQLFISRAQDVYPEFRATNRNAVTIANIVERLEGIPLAIELAAAHARALSPMQMLAELAARFDPLKSSKAGPSRRKTLKDTLDWSYQLLSAEAKRLFDEFSVFHGGFTLAAIQAICDLPEDLSALDELTLSSLVDVDQTGDRIRFWMLDLLRRYAVSHLGTGELGSIARRHAVYYLRLLRQTLLKLHTAERRDALIILDAEYANLEAATAFGLEHGVEGEFERD